VTAGGAIVTVDWVIPSGDALPAVNANVGDSIVFNWGGFHNVYHHPSGTCSDAGATLVGSDSGASWTAPSAGTFVFACDVGSHCEWGQIVTVTIT